MKLIATLSLILLAAHSWSQTPKRPSGQYVDDLFNVRFVDGSVVELTGGKLTIKGNESLQMDYLNGNGYWTRLYSGSEEKMAQLRENAERNLKKPVRDPNLVFLYHLNIPWKHDEAFGVLSKLSFVKRASEVPIGKNAEAPDFTASQLYLQNGPSGINAEGVWNTYGNHGEGIKVCDVEYNFNENHMDLPQVTYLGEHSTIVDYFDHGTAVFGEIASKDDGNGSVGIATGVELYFASVYASPDYNFEEAIYQAITGLGVGDILLIEQHMPGPNYFGTGQEGFVPMEWYESYFDALQLAVGQGIIVVEAAGNGGENLDDPLYSTDNGGHYPFLPGNGSGAILVGAGAATSDVMRSKLWFSNYGQAVRIQGNGESILTTGYGDLYFGDGDDGSYTGEFGGTSGASPIVVGAVALIQSVWEHETGERLTADVILDAMIMTGKPQTAGMYALSNHIGPLPNVDAAIAYLIAQIGLEEAKKPLLEIYPNPSADLFRIRADFDLANLVVTDVNGKQIAVELLAEGNGINSLRLPEAANGAYFLTATSDGQALNGKLIVNR